MDDSIQPYRIQSTLDWYKMRSIARKNLKIRLKRIKDVKGLKENLRFLRRRDRNREWD